MTILVPATQAHFTWLASGDLLAVLDGLRLPPGGIAPLAILEIVAAAQLRLDAACGWGTYLMIADREAVGLISIKDPPAQGSAEIGYGVAGERRRRGHAARGVALMAALARGNGLTGLTAETLPGNLASHGVLRANGFVETGTREDADDGTLLLWRKTL